MPESAPIDRAAFTQWVRRYGPELRLYCLKLTSGRQALADEVLQSAFSVAWAKRESFKGGNARAWLYCICRQQGLWRLRKEGRYVDVAPERLRRLAGETARVEEGPCSERVAKMNRCFDRLGPVDQAVVRLAYGLRTGPEELGDGGRLTYAEIGRVLAAEHGAVMGADGVRMRLKRTLAKMLRWMNED